MILTLRSIESQSRRLSVSGPIRIDTVPMRTSTLQKMSDFLRYCDYAGLNVWVVNGYRSIEEQDRLFAQGRTIPGDIVTYLHGGDSPHNFGLAFDVCFAGRTTKELYPEDQALWARMGAQGERAGLQWGGRWRNFPDRPHLQEPNWHVPAGKLTCPRRVLPKNR